jgi:tight adherence protein C
MSPWIVPILTFLSVIFFGGAIVVIVAARRRALEARLFGGGTSSAAVAAGEYGALRGKKLADTLEQVGRAVASSSSSVESTRSVSDLREKLTHAGFYDPNAATIFMGAQLLLLLVALPFAGLLALALRLPLLVGVAVVIVVTAVTALAPNVFVSIRRSRRSQEVREQLPDAIDLLEICVSSGMGLEMAWNAVADDFRTVSCVASGSLGFDDEQPAINATAATALRIARYRFISSSFTRGLHALLNIS